MMVLLDVGNTSVKAARLSGGRISTVQCFKSGDELPRQFSAFLREATPTPATVLASSVNPEALREIGGILDAHGAGLLVAAEDVPVGMATSVADPGAVGTDRMLAALAASRLSGCPVVVVDAGSAITVDLVNSAGLFAGGAILPGLALALQSLHRETALLPELQPAVPDVVVGADTRQAMLSGVFWGAIGAIDGLTSRMRALEPETHVVLTGGDAQMLRSFLGFKVRHIPHLVIEGLRLIADSAGLSP